MTMMDMDEIGALMKETGRKGQRVRAVDNDRDCDKQERRAKVHFCTRECPFVVRCCKEKKGLGK